MTTPPLTRTALARWLSGCAGALALSAASACGQLPAAERGAPMSTPEPSCADISVLDFVHYDWADELEPDPVSLAEKRRLPLVVSGEIEEVVEGPRTPYANEPGLPDEHATVAVKIAVQKELVVRDRSRVHDGYVYVLADEAHTTSEPKSTSRWSAGTRLCQAARR